MAHAAPSKRGPLVATVVLLALCSVLPARFGAWANSLGFAAQLLIAPVTQPVSHITAWLTGSGRAGREGPVVAQLERERDQFRTLWLQEQARGRDLERVITELQRGAGLNELPVRQLARPVIGGSSEGPGHLTVRSGSGEGVAVNAVATTAGVQVVGKVVAVGARTCQVRLITARSAGAIGGVVVQEDGSRGALLPSMRPIGEGKLQGLTMNPPAGRAPEVRIGQEVRLEDEQWPTSARMLLIGRVIDATTSSTGRQVVTVKPTAELERLSEVYLRLAPEERAGR
jgi:hypothetical protein